MQNFPDTVIGRIAVDESGQRRQRKPERPEQHGPAARRPERRCGAPPENGERQKERRAGEKPEAVSRPGDVDVSRPVTRKKACRLRHDRETRELERQQQRQEPDDSARRIFKRSDPARCFRFLHENTIVLRPETITRCSRWARTARVSTRRSMSLPIRFRSSGRFIWLMRSTSCSMIGPSSSSAVA